MVSQRKKDFLFQLVQPALGLLRLYYRIAWPLWSRGHRLRLHIGAGEDYLDSFINADINPLRKIDLWLDLSHRLPVPDGAIEGIYTLETLEHLYPDELERLLAECRRVMRPGGFLRIGVPNLARGVEAYAKPEPRWFPSWPRDYRSLGGKLSNFLMCDGQHRMVFDFSLLQELLDRAGFSEIERSARAESRWLEPAVLDLERRSDTGEPPFLVYVEAKRP